MPLLMLPNHRFFGWSLGYAPATLQFSMVFGQSSLFILVKWPNHLKRHGFISSWTLLGFNFSLNSFMTEALSYRNNSIDFLCKSMDCFLCDNSLRHERVKSFIEYRSDILTEHIHLIIELSAFDSLDKSLTFRSHVSQLYRSTALTQELEMCPRLAREKLLLLAIGIISLKFFQADLVIEVVAL